MAGKRYNPDGPSAEERALERFTELMIKKISSIKGDWKKPWFTENFMAWPKNLSGREYNGMNALMLMLLCEEKQLQATGVLYLSACVGTELFDGQTGEL